MSIGLNQKNISNVVTRNLEEAQSRYADSMEKLSSGKVFSKQDPRPAERALSDRLDHRIRSLSSSKKNINDAVSLIQTAESAVSDINNILVRMKELNTAASSSTMADRERRYLMIEYDALFDEVDRIAHTTEFNGIPLLNGKSKQAPEELVFRLDDPFLDGIRYPSKSKDDLNTIRFRDFKEVDATTQGLGINSAKYELYRSSESTGVDVRSMQKFMEPTERGFSNIYDQAIHKLASHRATYGAMQARLQHTIDYMNVYQENLQAAKSNITDTNYAEEVVKMTGSAILMQASSGLLAQSNFNSQVTMNLLNSVNR